MSDPYDPPDCEVCRAVEAGTIAVTVDAPAIAPARILFCRECMGAVFQTMADRWNEANEQDRIDVERIMNLLGVET